MKYFITYLMFLLCFACANDKVEKPVQKKQIDAVATSKEEIVLPEGPGVTFKVAKVEIAKTLLPDTNYKIAVEGRLNKEVFVCSGDKKERITPIYGHGFFQTVHTAYASHRPLVITPDHIWLMIEQGFAIHVNQNYAKYENMILKKDRPKIIKVREDSLVFPINRIWQKTINSMASKVESYVHDSISDLFVPRFSTTTNREHCAYQITLMETVKKSFTYVMVSGCGIPYIRLRGNKEDWQHIYNSLEKIKKYDLEIWASNLQQIIAEFIACYDGKVNTAFWNSIYKDYSFYDTEYISGWIIKFFPYVVKIDYDSFKGDQNEIKYGKNAFLDGEDFRLSNLTSQSIPSGYSEVEFIWDNYGKKMDMLMYSGFMGMKQNKENKELEAEIAWAVCKANAKNSDHFLDSWSNERLKHNEEFWVSDTSNQARTKPIYHPEKNKTYEAGILELKQELATLKLSATNIQFFVTWAGTIAKIEISGKIDEVKKQQLKTKLMHLNFSWVPATTYNSDISSEYVNAEIKTNYLVKIKF